jgi:hypothetical protein
MQNHDLRNKLRNKQNELRIDSKEEHDLNVYEGKNIVENNDVQISLNDQESKFKSLSKLLEIFTHKRHFKAQKFKLLPFLDKIGAELETVKKLESSAASQDLKNGLEEKREVETLHESEEIPSKELVIYNTRAQTSKLKVDAEDSKTTAALDEALLNFEKANQEHFTNGINEEVIKNHEIECPSSSPSLIFQLPITENVEVLFDSRNLSDEHVKSTENESFDSTKENLTNNTTLNTSLNTSGRKRKIVTTEVESDGTVIFTIIRKSRKKS